MNSLIKYPSSPTSHFLCLKLCEQLLVLPARPSPFPHPREDTGNSSGLGSPSSGSTGAAHRAQQKLHGLGALCCHQNPSVSVWGPARLFAAAAAAAQGCSQGRYPSAGAVSQPNSSASAQHLPGPRHQSQPPPQINPERAGFLWLSFGMLPVPGPGARAAAGAAGLCQSPGRAAKAGPSAQGSGAGLGGTNHGKISTKDTPPW